MKAALYPNFQKPNALSCAKQVCDVLYSLGIDVFVSSDFRNEFSEKPFVQYEDISISAESADAVIAIGGDGTILRCAKYLIGTQTRLLGINTGTLGFMAGLEADQLDKLSLLKTGEYNVSERMTLDIQIDDEKCGEMCCTALNEVCVRADGSGIGDFEVFSDNYLIGRYRADGVLFSTPSGSTAYALSAGGPVIEPDLECIEMTLICPHSLFSRATLFSSGRKLKLLHTASDKKRSMSVIIDGAEAVHIRSGQSVEICRGRYNIKFIDLIGNSFHESLCRKMMKPIK